MSDDNIPFAVPVIGQEEIDEVADSLESGWITTGPKVRQFEDDFAEYIDAEHAVATNSCTAALHLALEVLGVGPGDEVIVPTLTFCSTANVVLHAGADPVLVDVEPDGNVSAGAIADAVTDATEAVIPVHYAGQPCNLDSVYEVAAEHGLHVVEDAAHAVGAKYRGDRIGSDALGPALLEDEEDLHSLVAFSFYATKNMTTCEGGMITTRNREIADRLQQLLLHGMTKDAWKRYSDKGSWYYEVAEAGYKYNMTDIQAAVGLHQLDRLDDFIRTRRERASVYDDLLGDSPLFRLPAEAGDRYHAYHLYPIVLDVDRLKIDRSEFIERLGDHDIGASVHFIPLHLHPVHGKRGYGRGDCQVAERFYDGEVSLPMHPRLSEADAVRVAETVEQIVSDCT